MRMILDNKEAIKALRKALTKCEEQLSYERPPVVLYALRETILEAIETAEFLPVSQDTSRDISEIETVLKIAEGLYS